MSTAIVTGSGGLIGCASVQHFAPAGFDVLALCERIAGRKLDWRRSAK
jgi:NAD(P)-dependent dehydrogenase (short-subunit alcohol dehydrogenase family)